MSSRKTTYFPLSQHVISQYDFCRRHHTVEKSAQRFSIVWKNRKKFIPRTRDFSIVWNDLARFFHTVEMFFPQCGKLPHQQPGRRGSRPSKRQKQPTMQRFKL